MRISAETSDINKLLDRLSLPMKIRCKGIDCEKGVAVEVDIPILPNVGLNLVPQVISSDKISIELSTDGVLSGLNAAGALFGNDIMSILEKQSDGLLKRESKKQGVVELEKCRERFSLPVGIEISSIDLENNRLIIDFKLKQIDQD